MWKAYESTATLYDSASKIAAAEWLISNLEMATDDVLEGVTRLILALPAIRSLEVRTYVLSLLRNNPRLAPFLRYSNVAVGCSEDLLPPYSCVPVTLELTINLILVLALRVSIYE